MLDSLRVTLDKPPLLRKLILKSVYGRIVDTATGLVDAIKGTWELRNEVYGTLAGIDPKHAARMLECRPYGGWVTNDSKKMPHICEIKTCPHCVARDIERAHNDMLSQGNTMWTRVYAYILAPHDPEDCRQEQISLRQQLHYTLRYHYKAVSYVFIKPYRAHDKWYIGLNILIPDIIKLSNKNLTKRIIAWKGVTSETTDEAILSFIPRALGFNNVLYNKDYIKDISWYLNATYKLHTYRRPEL